MDASVYINLGRIIPDNKWVDRKLYKMLSFEEKIGYLANKFKQKYFTRKDSDLEDSV